MGRPSKAENGQVLVLLVLGIIGLLAFTALAIDGGLILVERRSAQNGADASSLTGGGQIITKFSANNVTYQGWDCSDPWVAVAHSDAVYSGIARADTNNYDIDDDVSDDHGITTACEDGLDNGTYIDKFIDVETLITSDIQTAFAHFITGQPVQQTTHAVARVRPQGPFAYGHAIVALNDAGCRGNQNGVVLTGNSNVSIDGGGIFSNGCMRANGNLDVNVTNGSNTYMIEYLPKGKPSVDPAPQQGREGLPDYATLIPSPEAQCAAVSSGSVSGSGAISAGRYSQMRLNASDEIVMASGLYCIEGIVKINAGAKLVGQDVTFYMMGGDFDTAGGATVQLDAPSGSSPSPAISNVLIYLAVGNTGEVSLLGSSDSWYEGTIFAPDGTIEVGGSGSLLETYFTQLIGWDVFIHGNATIDINYDGLSGFQYPPNIDLQR